MITARPARAVDGSVVDTHVFVSFACLFTALDDRLARPGRRGHGERGLRASVGMSWADRLVRVIRSKDGPHEELYAWLLLRIPRQAEVACEQRGLASLGVTFSYGIRSFGAA